MEHLPQFSYVRRNSDVAYRLAIFLEPEHNLILEDTQVISFLWPEINYSKDSLQEIHKRLRLRNEIALTNS